jgi:hypothetical protein
MRAAGGGKGKGAQQQQGEKGLVHGFLLGWGVNKWN